MKKNNKLPPPVPYTDPPCSIYNRCNAPICPLHNIQRQIWYANEEICRNKTLTKGKRYIRIQRKISRKISHRGSDSGYFSLDDLNSISRVHSKMTGFNPDSPGKRLRTDKIHEAKPQMKRRKTDPRLTALRIENLRKYHAKRALSVKNQRRS